MNILNTLRLTERKRQVLDQLLSSDQADKILTEREAKTLVERRELIAIIEAAPAKYVKAKAAADKRCAVACKAVDDSLEAVKVARAELNAANAEAMAAQGDKAEIADAQKRLLATADPRLVDARRELWTLHARTKMQLIFLPYKERNVFGYTPTSDAGNLTECNIAWAVLKESISQVEALRLAAASRDEITKALQQIIADTRGPLEAIGLKTFALDAELEVVYVPYEGKEKPSGLAAARAQLAHL
jgi:hypothetical protein